MATARSCLASAVVVGLVMLSLLAACVLAQVSEESAASAISEAEQAVSLGYVAVLGAEAAGGNVTGLMIALNDAAASLLDARRAFDASDFEGAKDLAESAAAAGGVVWDDAKRLEVDAAEAEANRTTWFLAASIVAVPLVLIASFFGCRYLKQWYYQRLMKMKPKVGEA